MKGLCNDSVKMTAHNIFIFCCQHQHTTSQSAFFMTPHAEDFVMCYVQPSPAVVGCNMKAAWNFATHRHHHHQLNHLFRFWLTWF